MNQVSNERKFFREYFTQAMHGQQSSKESLSVISKTIHSLAANNPSELSLGDKKIDVKNLKEKDLLIFTKFAKDVLKSSALGEAEGERMLHDLEQIQTSNKPNLDKQLMTMKRHILLNEQVTAPNAPNAPKGDAFIDTVTTNLINTINQKQDEVKVLNNKLPKQKLRDQIGRGLVTAGSVALIGGAVALSILGGPIGIGIGAVLALIGIIGIRSVVPPSRPLFKTSKSMEFVITMGVHQIKELKELKDLVKNDASLRNALLTSENFMNVVHH